MDKYFEISLTPNKNPELTSKIADLIDLLEKELEHRIYKSYGKTAGRIVKYLSGFQSCKAFIHEDNWAAVYILFKRNDINYQGFMKCFYGRDDNIKIKAKTLYRKSMESIIDWIKLRVEK